MIDVFGFKRMSTAMLRNEAEFNVNILRTNSQVGCKNIAAPCGYCFPCRLAELIETLSSATDLRTQRLGDILADLERLIAKAREVIAAGQEPRT